jgi:hypothetical protein
MAFVFDEDFGNSPDDSGMGPVRLPVGLNGAPQGTVWVMSLLTR